MHIRVRVGNSHACHLVCVCVCVCACACACACVCVNNSTAMRVVLTCRLTLGSCLTWAKTRSCDARVFPKLVWSIVLLNSVY